MRDTSQAGVRETSPQPSPWKGEGDGETSAATAVADALPRLTIAIDGPAGAGKSTVARHVARSLSYTYIDTGAMYRALAWDVLHQGILSPRALTGDGADATALQPDVTTAVIAAAERLDVRLEPGDTDEFTTRVFAGDTEITQSIRTPAISSLTSALSVIPDVRVPMVAAQRRMGQGGGVVMEGRDIGTVVLPNADLKVFLTASVERRARRRQEELAQRGIAVPFDTLLREIAERDARDASRDVAPMAPAADARILNSDPLSAGEVVAQILEWHQEALSRRVN